MTVDSKSQIGRAADRCCVGLRDTRDCNGGFWPFPSQSLRNYCVGSKLGWPQELVPGGGTANHGPGWVRALLLSLIDDGQVSPVRCIAAQRSAVQDARRDGVWAVWEGGRVDGNQSEVGWLDGWAAYFK